MVFYTRMKGELEQEVAKLNFRKVIIFRPSILDGNRSERRVGERIGLAISHCLGKSILKKYRPTPIGLLSSKMIRFSLDPTEGVRIIAGPEIFSA
jgi:hypothetical protein